MTMKSSVVFVVSLSVLWGCSSDEQGVQGETGGAMNGGAMNGGAMPGAGGTPANGGAPSNGGAPAAGGATTGMGGASPGTGGVAAGGVVGSGGSTEPGGSGGGGTSGGASASGGAPASGGAGGVPASGGAGGTGVTLNPNCRPADFKPLKAGETLACAAYTTPTSDGKGIVTQFGPYGAAADINMGKGFEITPSALDTDAQCKTIAASFGEDPKLTEDVLNLNNTDLKLYTVFRPANWKDGEKYPLITWGNGTCAQPSSYAALLAHVASYGFIVVAANGRFVANGAQVKALDMMFAANQDATSRYYGRIDTTKVGAMGHSQGSGATVTAARDDRVKAAILFNGGTTASKPFLAVSGDRDIGNPTVASYRSGVNGAPKAAFLFFHKIPVTGGSVTGHLTLMMQPDRVTGATTGFWQYILNGDATAKNLFVGTSCGLCNQTADFDFGQKGLD